MNRIEQAKKYCICDAIALIFTCIVTSWLLSVQAWFVNFFASVKPSSTNFTKNDLFQERGIFLDTAFNITSEMEVWKWKRTRTNWLILSSYEKLKRQKEGCGLGQEVGRRRLELRWRGGAQVRTCACKLKKIKNKTLNKANNKKQIAVKPKWTSLWLQGSVHL